jgi:Tol biopolymer transport system component
VSVTDTGAQASIGTSFSGAVSANGGFVAFISSASLVPDDTNVCMPGGWVGSCLDIYLHDLATQTTTRVSVGDDEGQGNGNSFSEYSPHLSADGRFIAFASSASNLVSGDTAGNVDTFVRDTVLGQTVRVSVSSIGSDGNGGSAVVGISDDGRKVAFSSGASNLISEDTNVVVDVFVRDLDSETTTFAS